MPYHAARWIMMCFAWIPAVGFALSAHADEGMWLFNEPPRKLLKEKYDFDGTEEWLLHVQRSSVRFNSGGSGSFVSAEGLVLTNHHVGADHLQKLSTAQKDLVKTGFIARTRDEEVKCVDLELNVLMRIDDVTERVNAAVKPDMSPAEAQKARRAISNTIEKESLDKTGLRSDVVTLFQGGQYQLYQYKKYTDVRLVFAPEKDIAFFGGDPDNFEYPRYDLDFCLFRVFEDDKPVKPVDHLVWSEAGAGDGELIFVSGHPGRTDRLNTVAHLDFLRDKMFPTMMALIYRREVMLSAFSEHSLESARRAQDELFGYENTRKARLGGLRGLQDPELMRQKRAEEQSLRDRVRGDSKLREYDSAWNEVKDALTVWNKIFTPHYLLERGMAFNSEKYVIARTLVRMAEEKAKPNAERLREYGEAGLESLEHQLFSEAPIYDDLEMAKLGDSLSYYMETVGANDELLRKVLDGKSPQARATELIAGSQLADVAVRKKLAEGGKPAIEASRDPMILLARLVDPPARRVRKVYDEQVEEVLRQAYAKISKARFAIYGSSTYPDATFTLRLAFGEVLGYKDHDQQFPPFTTMGGAFQHASEHGSIPPFQLPESWLDNKEKINLDTPFNFVSTADIIGGNSGSPVINRKGELVGLIFDGNIQSLVLDFMYTDKQARAISVHSASIIESLRNIYDADFLADELTKP